MSAFFPCVLVQTERLLPFAPRYGRSHLLGRLVRPGGLVIAHNMNRPEPDPRHVEAITQNPKLESVFLFMDAAGFGVTMKKR